MCRIQIIKYGCGHKRKVVQACETALKLGPVPPNRAPDFCLEGVNEIPGISELNEDCDRGENGLSCRELQVLKPLEERRTAIKKELASFEKRVISIQSLVNLGLRPEYDWEAVEQQGFKVKEFQDQIDSIFRELLPRNLERWPKMAAWIEDQVEATFEMASIEAIAKATGRTIVPVHKVRAELLEDESYFEQPENPDLILVEKIWAQIREIAHSIVESIEEMAVRTCLDDVGWQLPTGEDYDLLRYGIAGRLIQPLQMNNERETLQQPRLQSSEGVNMEESVLDSVLDTAAEEEFVTSR